MSKLLRGAVGLANISVAEGMITILQTLVNPLEAVRQLHWTEYLPKRLRDLLQSSRDFASFLLDLVPDPHQVACRASKIEFVFDCLESSCEEFCKSHVVFQMGE